MALSGWGEGWVGVNVCTDVLVSVPTRCIENRVTAIYYSSTNGYKDEQCIAGNIFRPDNMTPQTLLPNATGTQFCPKWGPKN